MNRNVIKKTSCLILIASFATTSYASAINSTAGASPTRPSEVQLLAEPSAEFILLEKVIALQGQGLSQQNAQTQITGALKQYAATALPDSQNQRMQDALVRLGVYTTAQAQEFMAQAQGAVANLQQSGAENAILQVALKSPKGAQFSFCSDSGDWLTFGGAFAILAGGVFGSGLLSDDIAITPPSPPGVSCLLTPNACPGPTNGTAVNAVFYGGLALTAVAFVSFVYATQANCD